jgi:putative thioredoxin
VTDEVPVGAHGAVDLSSLGARPASGARSASGAAVDEVTEENFGAVVERSRRLAIVIAFWAEVSPASRELTTLLAEVGQRYAGRLAVVRCEVQRNPAIAEALEVYSVPAVVGIIAGRPAPLFQGVATAEQIAAVYEQVLQIAASAGLPTEEASAGGTPAETASEPMPPRHREALEAMERGDAEAAVAAYSRALRENPKDGDARVGLARARHFQRTADADLSALIAVADATPGDIEAAFAAADAEVAMGRANAAFARLVDAVRGTDGARRESIRERLVELFEVVGIHDAAVAEARRALASALY